MCVLWVRSYFELILVNWYVTKAQGFHFACQDGDATFAYFDDTLKGHIGFDVPCWLASLVAAIVAAFPWIRRRFSLRTLLIATTVVAVVLGLVVWAASK